jgi:hypothetical protein
MNDDSTEDAEGAEYFNAENAGIAEGQSRRATRDWLQLFEPSGSLAPPRSLRLTFGMDAGSSLVRTCI